MRSISGLLIVLAILLTAFYSCNSDDDVEFPVIEFSSPVAGSHYSVPDSIKVKAVITDNNNIEWMKLDLVDKNQKPVGKTFPINDINKTSFSLNEYYPVKDIHLSSGKYYIQISASDGNNIKHGQQHVYINEAERVLQNFMVITRSNPDQVSVYNLDSNGSYHTIMTRATDYLDSRYLSGSKTLVICGTSIYNLQAYGGEKYEKLWEVSVVANPPEPYFTALSAFENETLLGFYQGEAAVYNHNGNRIKTFFMQNQRFPYRLLKHDDYLISAERSISNNDRFLVSYFYNGSSIYRKQFIDFAVQDMFTDSRDMIIIFANKANEAGIWQYNLTTANLWDAKDFPEDQIISSCKVAAGEYLASGNNNIYRYQEATNSLTTWKSALKADLMSYEDLTNSVLAVEGNTLYFYDFPLPNLKMQVNFPEEILAVHPVYNK